MTRYHLEHQSLNSLLKLLVYKIIVSDDVLQQNGPNIFCDSIKDFQHTEHINNSKKEPTVVGYSRKESFIEILQLFSKLRRNRKDNF